MSHQRLLVVIMTLGLSHAACGREVLTSQQGVLRARVIHGAAEDVSVLLHVFVDGGRREEGAALSDGGALLELPGLRPGKLDTKLLVHGVAGEERSAYWRRSVPVAPRGTTEIVFDLARPPEPEPPPCVDLTCDGEPSYELVGALDGSSASSCIATRPAEPNELCCADAAYCADRRNALCVPTTENLAEAPTCKRIVGCESGGASIVNAIDDTPCGASGWVCKAGVCTAPPAPPPPPPPPPAVGCADGAREGFLDLTLYPDIAACSGAWSAPGLEAAAMCARAGGDDGSRSDGAGCAALDLCGAGWHVCGGKSEVAARSATGCAGAVPPGSPDKSLFFAVVQSSTAGSVCDTSGNDNDVFGCGNLGNALGADKNCAPLDRVLASMQANRCGFNEAEPTLGPWVCAGGTDSHLHESGVVTKSGCPGASCSYDGSPVDNPDKGGVLCCRD